MSQTSQINQLFAKAQRLLASQNGRLAQMLDKMPESPPAPTRSNTTPNRGNAGSIVQPRKEQRPI